MGSYMSRFDTHSEKELSSYPLRRKTRFTLDGNPAGGLR
jgi:hypothetical protein